MWKLSCASLVFGLLAIVFAFLTPAPPRGTLTIKVDLTTSCAPAFRMADPRGRADPSWRCASEKPEKWGLPKR